MNKTGILYLTHVGYIGGAEKYLLNILDSLDRDKASPLVICGEGEQLPEALAERNIPCLQRIFRPKHPVNYLSNTLYAAKVVRRHKIKLIHADSITASLAAVLAARLAQVPIIAEIHDFKLFTGFRKTLIGMTDLMLSHSDAVQDYIVSQGFYREKVMRLYCGIEDSFFQPIEAGRLKGEGNPRIGFVGQIAEIKGIPTLLKALAEVACAGTPFQAFLLGQDFEHEGRYLQEMKTLTGELGLKDRVEFTGFVDNPQEWFASFDIIAMPSMIEPFGLVAVEALAQKKPLIVGRTGGLQEIVQEGVTGICVEPGSVDELTQALLKMLENPQWAKSLGEAGYQDVSRRFTMDKMIQGLDEIYQRFLGLSVFQC